jgi:hypothetical protein
MYTNERLVTVATFNSNLEASLARGALEAAGIRAFVPNEGRGTFSRYRGAASVGLLQVFESDRDRALVALRRLNLHVVKRRPEGE